MTAVWVDEAVWADAVVDGSPGDGDVVHTQCCRCPRVALCGESLDDADAVDMPAGVYPNDCVVCEDLEEWSWRSGVEVCPRDYRRCPIGVPS